MRLGVVAAVLVLALPGVASAARLVPVAGGGGFTQPVAIDAPRTDSEGTLYIVEQDGHVWRLQNGARTLFLDIHHLVSGGGEQGLLSIVFDPKYTTNRFFYVHYTNLAGDTRVVRYRADPTFDHADEATRRIILSVDQPYANHNGGQLAFGPNGRLYIGLGDGGSGCDPGGRAQNLNSRLGKILSRPPSLATGWRIDVYGLRNPWRFAFDRATGRMYIGDVGQAHWEEVDTLAKWRFGGTPENLGWDVWEGPVRSSVSGCSTNGLKGPGRLIRPISSYDHSLGCSITGGYAYRGNLLPKLRGWYFFGDYCSGRIWRLLFNDGRLVVGRRLVVDSSLNISSFGQGVRGELYIADHNGTIYKLVR
jgi:glucose/arabinose dehydrogenase